ncbi:MAG: KH domain-containing protein [Campylobacterales bacterium]|nr:KH domain-containing protein [Campylobacterales bacterium]
MSNIAEFISEYAKLVIDDHKMLEITENEIDDSFTEIVIYANKSDAGKLIGKDGNMVNALKTIISGCKAKDGKSYRVLVRSKES